MRTAITFPKDTVPGGANSLLTLNANAHPLMNRMHKPDPKFPPNQQGKRMVVVLEPAFWDA